MELRQHIGFLLLLIVVCYLIWAWNKDWENYKWYIPLGGGAMLFGIFEVFYWIVNIFMI